MAELIWLQDPLVFQRYLFVQILASTLPAMLTGDDRYRRLEPEQIAQIAIDQADLVARLATIKAFDSETNYLTHPTR